MQRRINEPILGEREGKKERERETDGREAARKHDAAKSANNEKREGRRQRGVVAMNRKLA